MAVRLQGQGQLQIQGVAMGRGVRQVARRFRGVSRRSKPQGLAEVHTPLGAAVGAVFDPAYYLRCYPDVAASGADPAEHYAAFGRAERRRPSVLFDPVWYLERNPDVAQSGSDPLDHFLEFGGAEGRDPIAAGFSCSWYLGEHPEVAEQGINPLVHFLTEGAAQGFDPCPYFDVTEYRTLYPDVEAVGLNPLAHFLEHGLAEGRLPNSVGLTIEGARGDGASRPVSCLLAERAPHLLPLRMAPGEDVPRINLVTDSIGADSLFGGVATSIVLGVLWADRTGRRLRIVTRNSPPEAAGLAGLYASLGVLPERQPELAHIPPEDGDLLPVGRDEVYLTTSWWTTTSVLGAAPPDRVVYLLQEDERAFYPVGGESLRATAAMGRTGQQVVVNTEGLRRHLAASGVPGMEDAVSFEPSFAAFRRDGRLLGADGLRHLFFYARPHNPRNLFDLGIAALDAAIEAGAFSADRWRIHLAGRSVPPVTFCDGSEPVVHNEMGWSQYRDFLGTVDLGLSLMASPHPSYPPLDLAAGGSVVVTNTWPGKPDLGAVSDRIVATSPDLGGVVSALVQAEALVEKFTDIPFTPGGSPMLAPWDENLAATVEHLARRFGDV